MIHKCNSFIRLNNNSTGYLPFMGLLSSVFRPTRYAIAALALITLGALFAALISLPLARTGRSAGWYQIPQIAVSRAIFSVLSVPEHRRIIALISSRNALAIRQNSAVKVRVDLGGQTQAAQYQPPESQQKDRRLMFRIALGLGLAYVGFLACWIWATRRRSGPPRH